MPLVIAMVLFSSMPMPFLWEIVPIGATWRSFLTCYLVAAIVLLSVGLFIRLLAWMFHIAKRLVIDLLRRNTPSTLSHGKPLGATQYFNILIRRQTTLSSKTSQLDR
jgi:hypothetical protein